jgi:ferric-dicitrate binding protein FerR (iron transport regulator)
MHDIQTVGRCWKAILALLCLLSGYNSTLKAQECLNGVAWVVSIQGRALLKSVDEPQWRVVRQGERICPGDQLRVTANSRAGLVLHNDSLLRLAENSELLFSAPTAEGNIYLDLLKGISHILSRIRHSFQINTPYINAYVEGTEFTVASGPSGAQVTVLEGQVVARNKQGEVRVPSGQQVNVLPGDAPQGGIAVNPRDAVQWALYYPPVVEPPKGHASKAVQQSLKAYRQGDLKGALEALSEAPDVADDADLLIYRASLYLQVGGIKAAWRDLMAAQGKQPDQSNTLALKSIIATANSELRQAMTLAQRAVSADARSPAAYLALSYAYQARFQLPEARKAAHQATLMAPENALAWARLAQLELMFRNLDASTEAAHRAVAIAPRHAQSQTTLGFARLIQFDLEGAQEAFTEAAYLDQAAPLPRLGLGLVQIRKSDLAGGRQQLELAANLDPSNALIRSYLGKAYYEEKRNALAATQFTLAKQFDKQDPTAWFYDAIRKQSENRPIEALKDIQTSIELNNHRAVYRSQFLLDQDEAARGASQARVYQELGFEQLARAEAYKSLQTSPQNHSAHRFLADSYIGRPRHERARLSELLQSQLLQPLNTNPIQPHLAVSKLGILDGAGPSHGGFSEYTSLFTREGLNLQLNAIGGNNSTRGDDLIVSGLQDKISFSLGQFHYYTDGWRENSDLRQDIHSAFMQASLSPNTSIQFEYWNQESESGDIDMKFDHRISESMERELERQFGRLGVHHQLTSDSHLVISAIYQKMLTKDFEREATYFNDILPPYGELSGIEDTSFTYAGDSNRRNFEWLFLQHIDDHVFTLGGGYYDENHKTTARQLTVETYMLPDDGNLLVIPTVYDDTEDNDPSFKSIYAYSLLALPAHVSMTLGATFEEYEYRLYKTDQFGPKFGLSWDVDGNTTLRGAYLKSIARPSHYEKTIEPTQVVGFNQYFDDVEGSDIEQFGVGFDTNFDNGVSIGIEFNRRDLSLPMAGKKVILESCDEKWTHGYLYWPVTKRLSMSLGYEKDVMERETFAPQLLTIYQMPIGFKYHWPSGMSFDLEGAKIDQKIDHDGVGKQEDFWNVNAVLGFRFPKRNGKAEIIVKNLLDKEFNYYDLSFFHGSDYVMPQYQPERQLFFRFSLNL